MGRTEFSGGTAPAPNGAAWGECEGAQFQFITAPLDACASPQHAPPAVNMLWRNIEIALRQRRSALGRREYFELVGRGRGYPLRKNT